MLGPISYLFILTFNTAAPLSTIYKMQLHNPVQKIDTVKSKLPNVTHIFYYGKSLLMHGTVAQ